MENTSRSTNIGRLIIAPFFVSLLMTILRLSGELHNWSDTWFSRETGGVVPTYTNWVVGITWLAIPIGVYMAYELAKSESLVPDPTKIIILSIIGLVVLYGSLGILPWLREKFSLEFHTRLLIVWSVAAACGAIQAFGWKRLFKALLMYGFASRAIIAIVMFLAMRGNWGTHYDYFDFPPELKTDFWSEYFWLAFFPQLIFWVLFTVMAGSLSGGITLAIISAKRREAIRAHA